MSTTPEVIDFTPPEQPPLNSVVLGKSGLAWQLRREGDGHASWCGPNLRTSFGPYGVDWARLLVEEAPLTVVYRAEQAAEQ